MPLTLGDALAHHGNGPGARPGQARDLDGGALRRGGDGGLYSLDLAVAAAPVGSVLAA